MEGAKEGGLGARRVQLVAIVLEVNHAESLGHRQGTGGQGNGCNVKGAAGGEERVNA